MKKIMFSLLGIAVALTLSAPVSWAWQKDSGVTCERVFASIKNEEGSRNWDGIVNANGNAVANASGLAASNEWVTVEWIPTSGFSGTVEATVSLFNGQNVVDSSETGRRELDCPEASPSPTPEVTPAPSNPGGPGDGKSDGLGCAVRDCSGNSAPQGQVLGASTKAVLGLSATSGDSTTLFSLMQLAAAFGFTSLGFGLFRKHN